MESEVELEKAKNEVLRKIGRNVMLFQQMEHMLKALIANSKSSGYISELSENHDRGVSFVHKQTMGQLLKRFPKYSCTDCEEISEESSELKEAHVSFTLKLEGDEVYYKTRMQALETIVAERNELIHHLLPQLNPNSIESCIKTDEYLDQQRERLLPEIDYLKNLICSVQECMKELVEFVSSDEGKKQFELSLLRQRPLVILLAEISIQAARADGWTLLNTAGNFLKQHAPDEVTALKDRSGHSTLKGLLLATELFDISEEPTDKGGIRVLYRLKM